MVVICPAAFNRDRANCVTLHVSRAVHERQLIWREVHIRSVPNLHLLGVILETNTTWTLDIMNRSKARIFLAKKAFKVAMKLCENAFRFLPVTEHKHTPTDPQSLGSGFFGAKRYRWTPCRFDEHAVPVPPRGQSGLDFGRVSAGM